MEALVGVRTEREVEEEILLPGCCEAVSAVAGPVLESQRSHGEGVVYAVRRGWRG